jgi:hypothetical protein
LPTSLQTPVLHWFVNTEQSLAPPPVHTPFWQVSPTLQNNPSSQMDPLRSLPLQLSAVSSQVSAQLPSPSGPGQGFPAWIVQAPFVHVSAPLQKVPSLHAVPV